MIVFLDSDPSRHQEFLRVHRINGEVRALSKEYLVRGGPEHYLYYLHCFRNAPEIAIEFGAFPDTISINRFLWAPIGAGD